MNAYCTKPPSIFFLEFNSASGGEGFAAVSAINFDLWGERRGRNFFREVSPPDPSQRNFLNIFYLVLTFYVPTVVDVFCFWVDMLDRTVNFDLADT